MVVWSHRDLSLSDVDLNDRLLKTVNELSLWNQRKQLAEMSIKEARSEKDFSRASEMKKAANDSLSEANKHIHDAQKAIEHDKLLASKAELLGELQQASIPEVGAVVDLEDCCICFASLQHLIPILKGKQLTSLVLDGNGLGDAAAVLIREALISRDICTESLSMRNTSLTTDGIVAICGTIATLDQSNPLRSVNLKDNGLANKTTVSASVSSASQFNKRVSISF